MVDSAASVRRKANSPPGVASCTSVPALEYSEVVVGDVS